MKQIEVNVYPNTESPKLFKNKYLEYLTKTHPIVIDVMYLIMSYFLIRYFYQTYQPSIKLIIGLFITGIFSWTLTEYLMHRFLYHKIEDATYNTGIQYLFHGIHHEYPNDKSRLVLPIIPSIVFASIFFGFFYLLMGKYTYVFSPGFLLGYCTYMTIHFVIHRVPQPKRFNFWWRHHRTHHFQQHDRAFGVSSPLWDIIFKTMPEKNRKTVTIKTRTKSHKG